MLLTGFDVLNFKICKRYLAQIVVTLECVNAYRDTTSLNILNMGAVGIPLLPYVFNTCNLGEIFRTRVLCK